MPSMNASSTRHVAGSKCRPSASRLRRIPLIGFVTLFFASNLIVFYLLGAAGLHVGIAFYLWLGIFFLLPFLIVVAMSLATRAMTAPPFAFAPDFPFVDLGNYRRLFEDSLYIRAFLVSLMNAALATVFTLLLGYPMALGLTRVVSFLGFLPREEDVLARLKAARVAVLPSRREGFGMVAVQAWACGLPVVACDEPESALSEMIREPCLGRAVPSTGEAVAAACADLLRDDAPGDRERRRALAAEYDLPAVVGRLREVYRRVAGPPA